VCLLDKRRNAALLLTVGGLLVALEVGSAQGPSFEVASVRENRSGGMTRVTPGLQPTFAEVIPTPAPGQISITNATLRHIIALAYGFNLTREQYALRGGPERILQARFNIVAKPPEGAPPSQSRSMLRTLLTERFKLRTHTETQQISAYVLKMVTESKLGPELRPSPDDCTSASMPDNSQERARLGPKDADGQWSVTFSLSDSPTPGAEPPGVSIFTAVREQLGLKLEQGSRPMDVIVIDSVEMPTPD